MVVFSKEKQAQCCICISCFFPSSSAPARGLICLLVTQKSCPPASNPLTLGNGVLNGDLWCQNSGETDGVQEELDIRCHFQVDLGRCKLRQLPNCFSVAFAILEELTIKGGGGWFFSQQDSLSLFVVHACRTAVPQAAVARKKGRVALYSLACQSAWPLACSLWIHTLNSKTRKASHPLIT